MYLVPIRSPHLGMYLAPISVVFDLWFESCSNFNEVMGASERAIRKIELSFCWLFFIFNIFYYALREIQYYWTDERYQIPR